MQVPGHFLLTSPPLFTAGLQARDIPCLDFLSFCLGLVEHYTDVYLTCLSSCCKTTKAHKKKEKKTHLWTFKTMKFERVIFSKMVLKCDAGSEHGGASSTSKEYLETLQLIQTFDLST